MRLAMRLLAGLAGLGVLVAAILWWALRPVPTLSLPERGLRLADVTLVEPGVTRSEHRELVVRGDRIASIGPASAESDAFTGHTVLPGLVDMHVHFPPASLP